MHNYNKYVIIILRGVFMGWEIITYEDNRGRDPVNNFLSILPKPDIAKAVWMIDLLERVGTEMEMPYSRHLRDEIWELRIRSVRILYFLHVKTFILLHGFKKKTDKTPEREIETARKRRKDWLERNEI